jgi:hypothetical protein
MGNLFHQK